MRKYLVNEFGAISSTIRNAVWLAFGAGIGPLIQLVATHWLARMYTPADYGQLALFMSMVGIVVTVSCLRYEAAIAAVDDEHVSDAVWVALLSACSIFTVLVFALFLLKPQVYFSQFQSLGIGLWGVPIYGLCGGSLLVALQLTLRRAQFPLNASFRSAQTVFFVLIALLCSGLGLVGATILASIATGVLTFSYLLKSSNRPDLNKVKITAREYRSHPFLLMPSALVDSVAISAPIFFMSNAYGASDTGHYFQVQKIVGAPLLLMAVVVGQLFQKRSGEVYRGGGTSAGLLWKSISVQSVVGLCAVGFLLVFGESLFDLLLGNSWDVNVTFLLLVTAPLLFRVIVSPISTIFITNKNVRLGVSWQIAYFLSTVTVLYIASSTLTFKSFLLVYGMHELLAYSVYLYLANTVARKRRKYVSGADVE